MTDPPSRLVTVNLSCDLLGSAQGEDWVDVKVTPTRVRSSTSGRYGAVPHEPADRHGHRPVHPQSCAVGPTNDTIVYVNIGL